MSQVSGKVQEIWTILHLYGAGNFSFLPVMKNSIAKQVKELTATYCKEDMLKPNTEADMKFITSDICVLFQNFGKIALAPDPSKCYIKERREVARVGEKATALLQVVNSRNKPCEEPIKLLECVLVSEIRGTIVKGRVERRGENQYKINYQPTMKGRHQFHVEIEGHHIRGSPFTLAVTAPVEKLGTLIQTIQIEDPEGVAIHENGKIIAISRVKHCVRIFSQNGEGFQTFGTRDFVQEQFNSPSGVAVDGEGNILVADTKNYRVQKFTAGGHFLTAVGTKGSGPLQFKYPWGITFNASNSKVYVTDCNSHCIQVLNSDLTFSFTYYVGGGRGESFPCGIACDSTGKVYVAEFNNHCIQVYTAEGEFLKMFGSEGQDRGELYGPVGVAVDTSDRVYVSEWGNHRVSVFTSEGQFLTSFGKYLDRPRGLAVDRCGVVYVCDSAVKIF